MRIGWALLLVMSTACNTEEQNTPDNDSQPPPAVDGSAPVDGEPAQTEAGKPPPPPPPPPTKVPGTWTNVSAGDFTMGSPATEYCRQDDETAHPVTLTRPFEITLTEVTQGHFAEVMGYNPSYHTGCGSKCPVEWVNWHEAAAYCNRLSSIKGQGDCYDCSGNGPVVQCKLAPGLKSIYDCKGYRLPTEAEWEYAARAGTKTAFSVGDILSCMGKCTNAAKIAWYKSTSAGELREVAKLSPNTWKLSDMSGNVYEWVNDWYQKDLGSGAATDPVGPASGQEKVFRGGAWYFNAEHARSANRERFHPEKRFTFLGFRCVRGL